MPTTPRMPSTTTAAASESGTQVVYAAPVDMLGHPTGLAVSTQVTGGSCESGSDSINNVEVYRCTANDIIYDPCWADSMGGALCMQQPWATSVVHLAALSIPSGVDVATTDLDYPWGVELTSGARCLAEQGAHAVFDTRTVDYDCTGGPIHGLELLRRVNRFTPYWTYRTAIYNGSSQVAGPTVSVATAWFAGPAPTSAASCQGQQLAVSSRAFTPSGGIAWLIFDNLSSSPCRLYGYPGVALVGTSGNQIAQVARSPFPPGSTPPAVVIPPGGAASAWLSGDPNYPNGSCPSYQQVLVTPPNTTTSTKVKVNNLVVCADAQINPVDVGGVPQLG
jgi:Domain of unknown function (DUF4232)